MLSTLEYEFAQIKYRWRIHSELFGTKDKVTLLNRCGAEVFALTQKLIIYDTLASLCRLCDSSKSMSNENNSIYVHYERQKPSLSREEIRDINSDLSKLKNSMINIRLLRNKALAHNDLKIAENMAQLPDITYGEIEIVLKLLTRIINKIYRTRGSYESVSSFGPGATKLLSLLEKYEKA